MFMLEDLASYAEHVEDTLAVVHSGCSELGPVEKVVLFDFELKGMRMAWRDHQRRISGRVEIGMGDRV